MSLQQGCYKRLLGYKAYNMIINDCPIGNHLTADEICGILSVDRCSVRHIKKLKKPFKMIVACEEQFVSGCVYAIQRNDEKYQEAIADAAYRLGARAFIATRQIKDYPCFVVKSVSEAVIALYGSIRDRYPAAKSIGVTGSIGKTTTAAMIKAVYCTHYNCICNSKNRNALSYVGRFIQCLQKDHERYIQECHEGDKGACKSISRSLKPSIMVLTNIAFSHLAQFPDKESFVAEFADVTAGMPDDGIVVYNYDDDNLRSINWTRKTVTVSMERPDADYTAKNIREYYNRTEFTIVNGNRTHEVLINIPGKHNVFNAMLAFAAAEHDNIPVEKIIEGIKAYQPDGIRQNILDIRKVKVFLDCYNAAPKSMYAAIDTLKNLDCGTGGSRIAVLGTMEELGEDSERLHADVGRYAVNAGLRKLIAYGRYCDLLGPDSNDHKTEVYRAKTKGQLDALLKAHIRKGDVVLFKASNAVHLERRVLKRFWFSLKAWKAFFQYFF